MAAESSAVITELRDRWLFWPAGTVFVSVFFLTFLCGLPGTPSFILIPLFVLGSPVVAVALLVAAGVLAAKKQFRKAASVILAILLPVLLERPIDWATECLHVGLTIGIEQLGSTSTQNNSQFAVYDWSGGLAGSTNTFLIHDMTDEIALPLALHKSSEGQFGEYCAGRVRHLFGHYYICTI